MKSKDNIRRQARDWESVRDRAKPPGTYARRWGIPREPDQTEAQQNPTTE